MGIRHYHEAKATGLAGLTIRRHTDRVHRPIRLEELADVLIGGSKRKIAYKNIHASLLYEKVSKQSLGYPNSMQKQQTQERYAGETAREPHNYERGLMIAKNRVQIISQNSIEGKERVSLDH
jgi:hypothetical protein